MLVSIAALSDGGITRRIAYREAVAMHTTFGFAVEVIDQNTTARVAVTRAPLAVDLQAPRGDAREVVRDLEGELFAQLGTLVEGGLDCRRKNVGYDEIVTR